MLKKIAGIAFAASLSLTVSAKDKILPYEVDFNDAQAKVSGRTSKRLVSQEDKFLRSRVFLYGNAKLTEGKSGQGVDFSDGRSKSELRFKTGTYYDMNNGTISFWLSPKAKSLGVGKQNAVLFEESNKDTSFSLEVDEYGRLKLRFTSIVPKKKKEKDVVYDEEFFEDQDKPKIDIDNRDELEKAMDEKKAADEAAKEEEEKLNIQEFEYSTYSNADVTKWPVDSWKHVAVTWDLRKGYFAVFIDGQFAMRNIVLDSSGKLMFFDRGNAPGTYIKFGPGKNGLSAVIDDVVISQEVQDREFSIK